MKTTKDTTLQSFINCRFDAVTQTSAQALTKVSVEQRKEQQQSNHRMDRASTLKQALSLFSGAGPGALSGSTQSVYKHNGFCSSQRTKGLFPQTTSPCLFGLCASWRVMLQEAYLSKVLRCLFSAGHVSTFELI